MKISKLYVQLQENLRRSVYLVGATKDNYAIFLIDQLSVFSSYKKWQK